MTNKNLGESEDSPLHISAGLNALPYDMACFLLLTGVGIHPTPEPERRGREILLSLDSSTTESSDESDIIKE
jgi:hypothetical protein